MSKTKSTFDEDVMLLCPGNRSEKFHRFVQPHCETPIVKGVITQLKRWPSDLFYAFLVFCLIIGSLIFLIFVTIAFCLPNIIDIRCRLTENLEIEESPNVYFLKLKNHTWSTREFCYIETAARKYPNLNVYLINLLQDESAGENVEKKFLNKTNTNERSSTSINGTLNSTLEERLRLHLVSGNANIQNINVTIARFFEGSKLSKIVEHLNDGVLEIAAKAQLLWNFPGIVLNPNMYCHLGFVERLVCNIHQENCMPDNLATIDPQNNIQATGVSCQAFMGFIVQEISKSRLQEKYTLQKAVKRYCPRLHDCPEIRILSQPTKCPTDELNCPIVYSSIILQDDSHFGEKVT